jgi:hypothetical protein
MPGTESGLLGYAARTLVTIRTELSWQAWGAYSTIVSRCSDSNGSFAMRSKSEDSLGSPPLVISLNFCGLFTSGARHFCRVANTGYTAGITVSTCSYRKKVVLSGWQNTEGQTQEMHTLRQDCFLPNPYQFLSHPTIQRYVSCNAERAVK